MKVSSKSLMAGLKPALMGAAGGYVGNQIANFAQKQSFMAGKESYSPAISVAVGIMGMVMMPKMKDFFQGMAVVSVTELFEKGTNVAMAAVAPATTTTTTQAQGMSRYQMGTVNVRGTQLGRVEQMQPAGKYTLRVGSKGIPVN